MVKDVFLCLYFVGLINTSPHLLKINLLFYLPYVLQVSLGMLYYGLWMLCIKKKIISTLALAAHILKKSPKYIYTEILIIKLTLSIKCEKYEIGKQKLTLRPAL